jgi:polysaccharide export outer membrane protein
VKDQAHRRTTLRYVSLLCLVALLPLTGCEMDSFLDPSELGRYEHTPVEMPILSRIDVIEETRTDELPVTKVRPQDLIPSTREYTIGAGDLITVSVFELLQPQTETTENRRVDQAGEVRLPVIGEVQAAGKTPSELEIHIADVLEQQQVLRDATVSVVMQQSQHNTFSVVSEATVGSGGVGVGTYNIPKPNFRLLDALAMARGVPGRTKRLMIFRQSALADEVTGQAPQRDAGAETEGGEPTERAPKKPSELIDQLMQPGDESQPQPGTGESSDTGEERPAPPADIERGLEPSEDNAGNNWVHVEGKGWVRADNGAAAGESEKQKDAEAERVRKLGQLITQRIIEIPYDRLINGDMRYNIVIRPGDVIKVPSRTAGFVYAMGSINRPGAYSVPGEKDLTLKQLIASAGGLSQLAIPERVDLVRRVDDEREAVVRLNVRAIFEGTQPDIFLKPNDLLNFGTSFVATPLAVFRNGLRMTYGFGFILDRNFNADVFGPPGEL